MQRSAITLDPAYHGGHYHTAHAAAVAAVKAANAMGSASTEELKAVENAPVGPINGMAAARKFGTICYRSRGEFDGRFDWTAKVLLATVAAACRRRRCCCCFLSAQRLIPMRSHPACLTGIGGGVSLGHLLVVFA